ncbi:MAG: CBS domain-containing protein [Stellaceae bacterium]
MTSPVDTLPETMTLYEAAAFLTDPTTRHPSFPVIDNERRVKGIVDPPTVIGWRRAGKHRRTTLGVLLEGATVPTVYPEQYLEGVIARMMRLNVAHLAVIAREDSRLAGYLSWKDLMSVRVRVEQEERERIRFYHWLRAPHFRRKDDKRPAAAPSAEESAPKPGRKVR